MTDPILENQPAHTSKFDKFEDVLIKLPDVKFITGLSKSSIYRFIEQGKFPKQISNGVGAVAWSYQAVMQWVNDRKENKPLGFY